MIFFKNKKIWLKIGMVASIVFMFFIVPCAVENANAMDNPKEYITKKVVGAFSSMGDSIMVVILQTVQAVAGVVLALGMFLVDLVTSDVLYDKVFFAPASLVAMNTGWGLVRDFVNMFFILILIFIAIATILRVNKYSDKKMIVYVVSAALFVNFSKPITMFVIDISNLAMSFFISNMREGTASYSSALMDKGGMGEVFKSDTSGTGKLGMTIGWIIEAIFKAVMGFMLMALALSLIIRMVALWVLIILSPLAFFAMALPGTAVGGMKDKWFKSLTYWCFYGPIMLFFFWLSLIMVTAVGETVLIDGDMSVQATGINKEGFVLGAFKILLPYISCLYVLYYGFTLAQDMAKSGASGAAWALGKTGSIAKGSAFIGTLGYGLGYGKSAYNNAKESMSKNREAGTLQKKAVLPGGKVSNIRQKSNLVDEETKKWDEKGTPSKEQLAKIMDTNPSTGNKAVRALGNAVGVVETNAQVSARQKAAAIKLAEKGNLTDGSGSGSYEKAMSLFKNDPKNLEKFKKASESNNRGSMIEYEIGQEMKLPVNEMIKNANERKGGTPMTPAEETIFRQNPKQAITKQKYEEHLNKMKLSDVVNQEKGFLLRDEVKSYIKEKQADKYDARFSTTNINRKIGESLDGGKAAELREYLTEEETSMEAAKRKAAEDVIAERRKAAEDAAAKQRKAAEERKKASEDFRDTIKIVDR